MGDVGTCGNEQCGAITFHAQHIRTARRTFGHACLEEDLCYHWYKWVFYRGEFFAHQTSAIHVHMYYNYTPATSASFCELCINEMVKNYSANNYAHILYKCKQCFHTHTHEYTSQRFTDYTHGPSSYNMLLV